MKAILAAAGLVLMLTPTASAEVLVLADGGRVAGELMNPHEVPRRQYVVRVADGATLTFDAAQVQKLLHTRPEEAEYERICPTYADTAAAQWELAQWCREHKLSAEREVHLRRVIELDPDNVEARRALGYSKIGGQWTTQAEAMIKRGYVRYKGQWKTPQEVEIAKNKHKLELAQQEWFQKLKRWRGWLGSDRDQQARDNIQAIDDPLAAKALTMGLRDEGDPRVRMMYVECLAKFDTFEAAMALAVATMSDPVEEVRLSCLDHLQAKKRPEVVAYFVSKLSYKKSTNDQINLAGFALGRMKDPSAIGPLIEALVTVHKFKIEKPGGDNATSATFGSAPGQHGTGMSAGGGPTYISKTFTNQAVLDALIALTGQNFNFDKVAWKDWYASQKKPPKQIDARRD
jgi:hypothetical protein